MDSPSLTNSLFCFHVSASDEEDVDIESQNYYTTKIYYYPNKESCFSDAPYEDYKDVKILKKKCKKRSNPVYFRNMNLGLQEDFKTTNIINIKNSPFLHQSNRTMSIEAQQSGRNELIYKSNSSSDNLRQSINYFETSEKHSSHLFSQVRKTKKKNLESMNGDPFIEDEDLEPRLREDVSQLNSRLQKHEIDEPESEVRDMQKRRLQGNHYSASDDEGSELGTSEVLSYLFWIMQTIMLFTIIIFAKKLFDIIVEKNKKSIIPFAMTIALLCSFVISTVCACVAHAIGKNEACYNNKSSSGNCNNFFGQLSGKTPITIRRFCVTICWFCFAVELVLFFVLVAKYLLTPSEPKKTKDNSPIPEVESAEKKIEKKIETPIRRIRPSYNSMSW